jgi:cell division protein FtsI/penicillin-binding protein 2
LLPLPSRRDWLLGLLAASTPGLAEPPLPRGDCVVRDLRTGRVLFKCGETSTPGLPGSTVKPFILNALLERGLVRPDERVACPGGLRVGGHNLECSHPRSAEPFDAVEALAASCNSWFVAMARRLGQHAPATALRAFGLAVETARSEDEALLQAIGLARVRATPTSLAAAFARLESHPAPEAVLAGLRAAVERGTAQHAHSERVTILGKTGTAYDAARGRTCGWFAGWAESGPRGIALAVRLAQANSGWEAAIRAKELAEAWQTGHLG